MASLIWSATLSGWPIDTDSLVNKYWFAATNVERHQRGAVDRLELVQTFPQLCLLLVADQVVERLGAVVLNVFQDERIGTADRPAPRQAVDRHALGDLPQPAGEAPGVAKLG